MTIENNLDVMPAFDKMIDEVVHCTIAATNPHADGPSTHAALVAAKKALRDQIEGSLNACMSGTMTAMRLLMERTVLKDHYASNMTKVLNLQRWSYGHDGVSLTQYPNKAGRFVLYSDIVDIVAGDQ